MLTMCPGASSIWVSATITGRATRLSIMRLTNTPLRLHLEVSRRLSHCRRNRGNCV